MRGRALFFRSGVSTGAKAPDNLWASNARLKPRSSNSAGEQALLDGVCGYGALILAAHLLDDKRPTTHRNRLDMLAEYGAVHVERDSRLVFDGRVATSVGITAGIDLALAIVARHWGLTMAEKVAGVLEWDEAGEWSTALAGAGLPSGQ
jgi:transcriptional regulator GlxA family with amidase domain